MFYWSDITTKYNLWLFIFPLLIKEPIRNVLPHITGFDLKQLKFIFIVFIHKREERQSWKTRSEASENVDKLVSQLWLWFQSQASLCIRKQPNQICFQCFVAVETKPTPCDTDTDQRSNWSETQALFKKAIMRSKVISVCFTLAQCASTRGVWRLFVDNPEVISYCLCSLRLCRATEHDTLTKAISSFFNLLQVFTQSLWFHCFTRTWSRENESSILQIQFAQKHKQLILIQITNSSTCTLITGQSTLLLMLTVCSQLKAKRHKHGEL